jgi:hypothetical protein
MRWLVIVGLLVAAPAEARRCDARWDVRLGQRTVRCCAEIASGFKPQNVDGYRLRPSCPIRGGFQVNTVNPDGNPGPVVLEFGQLCRLGRCCPMADTAVSGSFLGPGTFQTDTLTGTCRRRTFELRRMQ